MGELLTTAEYGTAEWEVGLPFVHELPSLSQALVPSDLASAFRVLPEPLWNVSDVNRASQSTLSSLLDATASASCPNFEKSEPREGSDPKRIRVGEPVDEVDAKTPKTPRLVWTSQLHGRFVEVVARLGLENAGPKTIMRLMNVDGLTRENVASHLQKYRLFVKRKHGLADNTGGNNHQIQMTYPPPSSVMPAPSMVMAVDGLNWGNPGGQAAGFHCQEQPMMM